MIMVIALGAPSIEEAVAGSSFLVRWVAVETVERAREQAGL